MAFKKEASLKLKNTIVISEEGFETLNATGKSTLNWSAFIRFTETRNIFMLYVQSRMFHLIPKHALSPEDVDGLRELLKRHISTKPAGRTGNPNVKVFLFFLIVAAAIVMVYFAIHRIHA
jgi:YcxB-like protein